MGALVRTLAWALVAGACAVRALFADQAGLNDWTKQHVGEVIKAARLADDRSVVVTKQGVVAALLDDGGEIVWRRIFPYGDAGFVDLKVQKDVILTQTNRSVHAWNADGQLLWDFSAEEVRDMDMVDTDVVAILTKDKVASFNLLTGVTNSKATKDVPFKGRLELLTVHGMIRVISADVREGTASTIIRVMDGAGSISEYVSSRNEFVVLPNGRLVFWSESSDKRLFVRDFLLGKSFEIDVLETGLLSPVPHGQYCVVSLPTGTRLIPAIEDGMKHVISMDASGYVVPFENLVWVLHDGMMSKYDGTKKDVFTAPQGCKPLRGWQLAPRDLMTLCADGSLIYIRLTDSGLKVQWTRDEALAQVVQVVSTSIPHAFEVVSPFGQIGRLIDSVKSFGNATITMSRGIIEALMRVAKGGEFELKSVLESSEEERARFGFNRMLIMLTKTNKLFGIHSETAAIAWTKPLENYQNPVLIAIHETDPDPRVLVLDVSTGKAEMISSITGRTLNLAKTITNGKKISQFVTLDALDMEKTKTVIALLDDNTVVEHPYPSKRTDVTFMHLFDASSGEFRGFRLEPNVNKAVLAWSMNFASNSKMVAFASTSAAHDPISSSVRSLGDGSLLVKHVNPHLVAIAMQDDGLKLHLVDSVSGRVVHRASHKDGSAPVHAVRFENWLVYSYWNTRAKRVELVSITLYEKTPIGKRQLNPWSTVPKILESNLTGFEAPDLTILQKSYLLPGYEITALGVTTTLRGIAAKNLLVSLGGTGQVLMLDQRLIDPRRTAQPPTEEEKIEGLFQYQPELPVQPTAILSYYRGAGDIGAHLFYVTPSLLESTCTVVAAGLDIFKGRASPSGTFDLLAEDFNYALLVLLIFSLGAVVLVLRSMEKRKSLEAAWA